MMKNPHYILLFALFVCLSGSLSGQEDSSSFRQFFYPEGGVASEGYMRDGKPDGYWKTYYEDGKLKSEGNRKNFELDSLWKFYDEEGNLILEVNYKKDKKNGLRKTLREGEVMTENFIDDVKQGMTTYYFPDGKARLTVPFVNGYENGYAREYDTAGNIVSLLEYKRGFIVSREYINRRDKEGRRQGAWKQFWDNGNIRSEGTFRNDKKNGYFKDYMQDGKMFRMMKYEMDSLIPDAEEIARIDERADYYPNGRVKIVAQYKSNVPDGIRREYSPEGKLERGSVYRRGVLVSEGITDEAGLRQGPWKDFYEGGELKAEGKYKDGKRIGGWKFYHANAQIEEEGIYDNRGRLDGDWRWYYDTGQTRREESYSNGKEDGPYREYDEDGSLIVSGEYVEGEKQGKWLYQYGDFKEEGTYLNDQRDGEWKAWYANGKLAFEGRFVEEQPDGRHTYYWDTGLKKDEGYYVMGKKEGDWYKYNQDGSLFLIITYKDGLEKKFDGRKIVPEIEPE